MAYEFRLVRQVEFSETDMAGIVHYSNFFRYMEAAEHAFFRALGYSVLLRGFTPPLGLPRVHASCDYLQPLRFEDEFEIHMLVTGKKSKSLSYAFRFLRRQTDPVVTVARGALTVVCVSAGDDGALRAHTLPREIADRIEVAPDALLESVAVPKRT